MPVPWARLAELIRLRSQWGTLLLLLPTWWALVVASQGRPSLRLLAVFTAGAFVMRSAGVILNDLADQSFDRQVERTRQRPLAAGTLDVRQAAVACVLLLAFAAGILLMLPPFARWLGSVAFLLAAAYPFAKRVFALPQAVLGAAFGWGVIMAWAAVQERLPASAWLLYGATVCWAIGYDTVYAIQDRKDDARIGVQSAAVLFGDRAWAAVAVAYGVMLSLIAVVAREAGMGVWTALLLGGVAVVQAAEVDRIRRGISGADAFRAFQRQAWVGAAILTALWLGVRVE